MRATNGLYGKRGRCEALKRLLKVHLYVQEVKRVTSSDISLKFNVDVRTARRDLNILEEVTKLVRIDSVGVKGGTIYLVPSSK